MAAVGDVYQSLKAALDMFKVDAPATSDTPSKQALVQAAERVKNDAAKIGLMCSGGAPPADQQLSLATTLQQSCVAFCTLCHAATSSAGPSLKDSLVLLAQNLVNPCLALLKDMGSGKDLKNHVGLVWERVAAVEKAPVDNKACLFAALAKVMAVMKDTSREMEELQEEQQEEYGEPVRPAEASRGPNSCTAAAATTVAADTPTTGAAAGATSSSAQQANAAAQASEQPAASSTSPPNQRQQQQQQQQGQEGSKQGAGSSGSKGGAAAADLDFEADEMTYWERQLLAASINLLQASTAVLRAFGRALLQGPALPAGSDALDSWESCVWHSKHLQRAVEDLGAAMYPPQDLTEVCGAAQAVFEVTELMMDECPDLEAVGSQQLSGLNQQLSEAHQTVQEWLKQATEQQQQPEPAS